MTLTKPLYYAQEIRFGKKYQTFDCRRILPVSCKLHPFSSIPSNGLDNAIGNVNFQMHQFHNQGESLLARYLKVKKLKDLNQTAVCKINILIIYDFCGSGIEVCFLILLLAPITQLNYE
jgi:hypothetical protein